MFKWVRKIKTFKNIPKEVKLIFAEALITSAWVKLSLIFFPFKRVMGWLGSANIESDTQPNEQTIHTRKNIRAALQLCKKYALWPTECYTLSLTGKILLKRRKINGTLYIGFIKSEEGKYKGHAWLRSADTYICGFKESIGYPKNLIFS